MKSAIRFTIAALSVVLFTLSLMGCASSPTAGAGGDAGASMPAAEESMAHDGAFAADGADEASMDLADGESQSSPADQSLTNTALQNRKIIREATIQLEAQDITTALNQATVLSIRVGGYTIGSNSWKEAEDRQYASLSFAVPVERFEEALEQARRLGKVTSENSTSQDVTAQYVDVEARISNLEATAERIRGFLVDATDLEYMLEVNRELSRVEGDLESLKGQRNVLAQKTSFSKIHLDLVPPPVTPTTTEVLETATVWSPVSTFNAALAILLDLLKAAADVAIWLIVVGLPFAVIAWFVWVILRRVAGARFVSAKFGSRSATSTEAGA